MAQRITMRLNVFLLAGVLLLTGCSAPPVAVVTGPPPRATYRSEKFGIEMQYPPAWRVMEDSVNRSMTGMNVIFDTGVPGQTEGFTVNDVKRTTLRGLISHFDKLSVKKPVPVTIGGEQGQRLDMVKSSAKYFFVKHGDKIYVFSTTGPLVRDGVIDSVKFLQ